MHTIEPGWNLSMTNAALRSASHSQAQGIIEQPTSCRPSGATASRTRSSTWKYGGRQYRSVMLEASSMTEPARLSSSRIAPS
jgi:hypothetical protein